MEQRITFRNSRGFTLNGILNTPPKTSFPLIIICHGYASNVQSKTRIALSQALIEKNVGSFGFDFTGCGKSQGKLFELTLTQGLDDLQAAYRFASQVKGVKALGLLGSSFSGSVSILFVANHPTRVQVLALKSPVSDYAQIRDVPLVAQSKQHFFFDDARTYDVYLAAERIEIPTLIVHGSEDSDVPCAQSQQLYERLHCPKKIEVIEGANHRYADPEHFSNLINYLCMWFAVHLADSR